MTDFKEGDKVHVVDPNTGKWSYNMLRYKQTRSYPKGFAFLVFDDGYGYLEARIEDIRPGWVEDIRLGCLGWVDVKNKNRK